MVWRKWTRILLGMGIQINMTIAENSLEILGKKNLPAISVMYAYPKERETVYYSKT